MTSKAEKIIHDKGILSVPDFIANAGGVICAAVEYHGGNETAAFQTIEEKIRENTEQVLNEVAKSGILPRKAATDLAIHRVKNAMTCKRWSIF